jgi:glycosyltransferase 2 family protein
VSLRFGIRWGGRLVGALLLVAALGWIGRTFWLHWEDLQRYAWDPSWGHLLASVLAYAFALSWGVWVWKRVLRHFLMEPIPYLTLHRIWFLSSLARYIPGKIFQFVAMARLGTAFGLSPGILLTSALVQMGFTLLAALFLGTLALGGVLASGWGALGLPGLSLLLALVGIHPRFINLLLSAIPRLLGRSVLHWGGSWKDGGVILIHSFIGWLLAGAGFALLVESLAPVPKIQWLGLAGVNALSFVAGYLSILPGGLGLRELALTELLQPFLVPGIAAVTAVAARIVTLASEGVGAAASWALTRGEPVSASDRPTAD